MLDLFQLYWCSHKMACFAVQPVCEIPSGAKVEFKSLYPTVSAIPNDKSATGWGYLIVKIRSLILYFPNINKMQVSLSTGYN